MARDLGPGTILDLKYRLVRCIGRGGMGAVYEAVGVGRADRYAIKVLTADVQARPEIFARFRREAEVTSALRHPNIVSAFDFKFDDQGPPYIVMEYLDGSELTSVIRPGPVPTTEVLDIVGQIASALSAVHALGIVHRDLKPQNIYVVPRPGGGRLVKVLDFGISKVKEATTKLTQASAILGTPQYMSPEQAQGRTEEVDHRTDQFALAAITYEAFTGREAFRAPTAPAVFYQIVHESPRSMREFNPNVSEAVEAVVFRGLAKRPGERFDSVAEFHQALVQAGEVDATVIAPLLPLTTWDGRRALPATVEMREGGSPARTGWSGAVTRAYESVRGGQWLPRRRTTLSQASGEILPSASPPKRRPIVAAGALLGIFVSWLAIGRSPEPPVRVAASRTPTPVSAATIIPIAKRTADAGVSAAHRERRRASGALARPKSSHHAPDGGIPKPEARRTPPPAPERTQRGPLDIVDPFATF